MSAPTAVLDRTVGGLRAARARVLTPSREQVDPVRRGFDPWAHGPSIVAPVGHAFLDGFATACREPSAARVLTVLRGTEPRWRGFAVEGAGMAATIRSRTEPWSRRMLLDLLRLGPEHTYLVHVGVGWGMARLPRPLWPDVAALERAVVPLVLDGYGFHEVFFRARDVLRDRRTRFPLDAWPGGPQAATQHLAQGVGRGLWFAAGGSPDRLADVVGDFPADQHASLWAGTGLAAGYAGGRDEVGLRELLATAGPHRAWLRQGCAFAVEARARAGTLVPHTRLAAEVLCGRTAEEVAEVVDALRLVATGGTGSWHDYESWRTGLAGAFDHD